MKTLFTYVDLGLSVKWATCNVGAEKPEDSGDYLAYNEAIALKNIKVPTIEQWQELIDNCKWEWTGKGCNVISKNGNSVFLPAAGNRDGAGLSGAGSYGEYWSSSLYTNNPYYAWGIYFGSGGVGRGYGNRYYGYSVRPISE